jgi:hypothetical protein
MVTELGDRSPWIECWAGIPESALAEAGDTSDLEFVRPRAVMRLAPAHTAGAGRRLRRAPRRPLQWLFPELDSRSSRSAPGSGPGFGAAVLHRWATGARAFRVPWGPLRPDPRAARSVHEAECP